MNFYHSAHLLPIGRRLTIILIGLALPVFLAGCQKNEPQDASVVPPPGPVAGQTDSDQINDLPGELELPEGANLDQTLPESTNSSPDSGGLEMPTDAAPTETAPTETAPTETGAIETGSSPANDIRYATWQQIHQQATSTGKVTVVDLWSLVCEPCLKEFPGLVRLHRDYGDRIQCIAVDVDFDGRKTRPPETYEERVSAFIESVGARFPTYISRTPSDDVYAANDLASIPAVLIYGADGELVQIFEDAGETAGFTYEKDIVPLVKKLAG